ncbi:MAG: hypothetical protein ABIH88_00170, partial [Patescibacteria group bacterium]
MAVPRRSVLREIERILLEFALNDQEARQASLGDLCRNCRWLMAIPLSLISQWIQWSSLKPERTSETTG